MSSESQSFVIVGGGLTGAKTAETLREEGFEGRLTLIGDEAARPYERPPLSKEYLRGEAEGKPFVHEEGFYGEHEIELETATRASAIDPGSGQLELEGGRRLDYDRLLIATGAAPRRLPIAGADLDGIYYLRELGDSEEIGRRISDGGRLVVIGAGWIGAEVAASARQKGCDVTLIEMTAVPLERVLGPKVGAIYRDIHADHGVDLLAETAVERFEGEGAVERVVTEGGAVQADFVVVGIGVAPRTELAEAAGLRIDNGILTDERLETSAPGIFAAGDVANARHPFYGHPIRVEHWANALTQGPIAARAMLDREAANDEIPYFFSDQYDVGMEYGGLSSADDEVVFRGDVDGREFVAFWLAEDRIVAGMNVNVWDVNEEIRELIRARRPVDRARLADPDTPLSELGPGAGEGPASQGED